MSIPVISNSAELALWRTQVSKLAKTPIPSRPVLNLQVSSKQGGNYITWAAMQQQPNAADGYIVQVSSNGDFSAAAMANGTASEVTLKGNTNTTYFDSVPTAQGATPATRYYKVIATTGTQTNPQSVRSKASGMVSSSAIPPNNTTTASTTTVDTTTPLNGGSNYHGFGGGGNRADL